jgi:hypothetical protein
VPNCTVVVRRSSLSNCVAGFLLLLLACLLYVSPELFQNRRYLSYLHLVLVSSSATSFVFAELKAQGLVGGLFELLATVSNWIYPALLAFGMLPAVRLCLFARCRCVYQHPLELLLSDEYREHQG